MKRKTVDKNDVETVTLSSSENGSSTDDKSEFEVISVDTNTPPTTTVVDAKTPPTVDFVDENVILVPNSEETVLLTLSDKKSIFFKGKLSVEVLSGSLVNI